MGNDNQKPVIIIFEPAIHAQWKNLDPAASAKGCDIGKLQESSQKDRFVI